MNELFNILDEKWNFFEMTLLKEDENILKYLYSIDLCHHDECGIIEFEKETLHQLVKGKVHNLSHLLVDKKINILKPYTGKKDFYLGYYDLSVLLPIRILIKHLILEETILIKRKYINMKYVNSMKNIYPNHYNKIIKILEETKEAERRRLS